MEHASNAWNLILALISALLSGGTGLLVTLLLRKLDGVSKDLKEIGEKVGKHAEALAEGKATMQELSRRLAEVEKDMKALEREGCARVCNGNAK